MLVKERVNVGQGTDQCWSWRSLRWSWRSQSPDSHGAASFLTVMTQLVPRRRSLSRRGGACPGEAELSLLYRTLLYRTSTHPAPVHHPAYTRPSHACRCTLLHRLVSVRRCSGLKPGRRAWAGTSLRLFSSSVREGGRTLTRSSLNTS